MASSSGTPSITPQVEARFRAIADVDPPLEEDQIKEQLSRNPAIEPKVYHKWVIEYLGQKARQALSGEPVSVSAISELLKNTHYDDPTSMFDLVTALNPPTGIHPVPLGHYTPSGGTQTFCFLEASLGALPVDIPPDPTRGEAFLTQVKCSARVQSMPEFILQIGQLATAHTATAGADEMMRTEFIVGVASDRKVFAFWNPLGEDPEDIYTYDDDDVSSPGEGVEAAMPRLTAGALPGLTQKCTFIRFDATIDDLLVTNRAQVTLPFSGSNMIPIPDGATIKFGGIDAEGWKLLGQVSTRFAAVPRVDGSGTATAPAA